jgi:ADP-ribose pyrophosphatase YjhB (NUDIX family)
MKQLAVLLFVLPNGKIILQRRTLDAPKNPGLLGMYGGHIEEGESAESAVRRELEEETSLKATNLHFEQVLVHDIEQDKETRRYIVFRVEVMDDNFETYEGEHKEVFSKDQIMKRDDLAPYVKDVVAKLVV